MNKTININLAGNFFHIDEDAYQKLQRYLEAIKNSLTNSQGQTEILSDIEARIAELFGERVIQKRQVVSLKEVEEIINIMGQPEDYVVDEEIFDDEPINNSNNTNNSSSRKLFRDTDNAYIGGVSSGLAYYFGVDTLWIRILWVFLFFGFGTGILLYILLWILMPAAKTTADKLAMSGKPINISNIEEKVREGFSNVKDSFDDVADRISNANYDDVNRKVKDRSRSFFDALRKIIMFIFTIFSKFIGVILILMGASTLIGLIIALFTVGVADLFNFPSIDFANAVNSTNLQLWLVSTIALFAVGIPFFYLLILGLKILSKNIKPIGNITNFSLLGIWLASIITLVIFTVKEINEHIYTESVTLKTELAVTSKDTLYVKMSDNVNNYRSSSSPLYRNGDDFKIIMTNDSIKKLYNTDVRLIFRSSKDSLTTISVEKIANGSDFQTAKQRAKNIDYNYAFTNKNIELDPFLLASFDDKFSNQRIKITIYIPEGTIVWTDENTYSFHRNTREYKDILDNGFEEHFLKVTKDDVLCLDCAKKSRYNINMDINLGDSSIRMNGDSLRIDTPQPPTVPEVPAKTQTNSNIQQN
ncbi:PspC domain-containing protein [Flavobacteriaceae bacterium]|jgi:phage shock protein PspC (stress-responsive transcriptional regulator)|nr:PspC domain-containing protein [Flavobacteriaceae bacterium]